MDNTKTTSMNKPSMFLLFALAIVVATPNVYAQFDQKMTERQMQKEASRKAKYLSKAGWTIHDTQNSLEQAITLHYQALQDESVLEIVGVASSVMSKNVGKQAALNNACNEYARQATNHFKSQCNYQPFAIDDEYDRLEKTFDKYELLVAKEIKNALRPSFTIIRTKRKDNNGKAVFEMMTFYLVNEGEAMKVRKAAMMSVIEEGETLQQYSNTISKFAQERFEIEKP